MIKNFQCLYLLFGFFPCEGIDLDIFQGIKLAGTSLNKKDSSKASFSQDPQCLVLLIHLIYSNFDY